MRDDAAVVVVGAGAIGSSVLHHLVREAVTEGRGGGRSIFVVDPDILQAHNIAKSAIYGPADIGRRKVEAAAAWARSINPALRVIALPHAVHEVGLGPFLTASVVFICADTYRGKMDASRAAWRAGVPLIMIGELAGGESLASRYRWFRPGREHPCLECNWSEEYRRLEVSFPCTPPPAAHPGPVTRLTVATCAAALMLEEARRLLQHHADADPALEVRLYPETRRFDALHPRRNPSCLFCHQALDRGRMILLQKGAEELTLGNIFALAEQYLPGVIQLVVDAELASAFACPGGHTWPALQRLNLPAPRCPRCAGPGTPAGLTCHMTRETVEHGGDVPLLRIVPPGDVLTFVSGAGHSRGDVLHLALPAPSLWTKTLPFIPAGGDRCH